MIEIVKYVLLGSIGSCLLWLFIKLMKGKSTKKVLLWSCFTGVISLFFLGLVGENVVLALPMNPYTVGVSAVLGIPGVILLTLTKIIWQL